MDERDTARQEHKQALAAMAAAFGEPTPTEPADAEAKPADAED